MTDFRELVLKTRSYRRFDQSQAISLETVEGLVDLIRQVASGSNKQPLKYILVADAETNAKLFALTRWAGALPDWPGPAEGKRPTAYVVVLTDTSIRKDAATDMGIAAQTLVLGAMAQGYGACMLGAIDRPGIRALFDIPERYDVSLVVAMGVPGETVVLEPVGEDGETDYYRDENDVHHVPKRSLDEVVLQKHG